MGGTLTYVVLVGNVIPVMTVITSRRLRETVWKAIEVKVGDAWAKVGKVTGGNMVHPIV